MSCDTIDISFASLSLTKSRGVFRKSKKLSNLKA